MTKGTTNKRDGLTGQCAICGSPRVIGYQKIGMNEIYVCRRLSCLKKWRERVRFLQQIYDALQMELDEIYHNLKKETEKEVKPKNE